MLSFTHPKLTDGLQGQVSYVKRRDGDAGDPACALRERVASQLENTKVTLGVGGRPTELEVKETAWSPGRTASGQRRLKHGMGPGATHCQG